MMDKQENVKGKTTLVRRVSDLFRADRKGTVSPLLLHRASMQKLRHCCQNLNLFPILFFSYDQGKASTMPISKLNPTILMARLAERIYRVYSSITYTIIRGLGLKSLNTSHLANVSNEKITKIADPSETRVPEFGMSPKFVASPCEREFKKFVAQKPKRNSLLLKLAVYLVPLLLAFQLIGLICLMIFEKYSAGFVFLVTALIFLGCISMKVLNHDADAIKTFKRDKRKKD